jgi:hypothetical protein
VSELAQLAELAALYEDVDALYQGASCERSTECCRFGLTGREPHVTSIELAMVRRALGMRGGWPAKKHRALPLSGDGARERACPMLTEAGRCAVYAARPLGCRTFYCTRAVLAAPVDRRALREVVRRLSALALRHSPQGDQPRLFSRALSPSQQAVVGKY